MSQSQISSVHNEDPEFLLHFSPFFQQNLWACIQFFCVLWPYIQTCRKRRGVGKPTHWDEPELTANRKDTVIHTQEVKVWYWLSCFTQVKIKRFRFWNVLKSKVKCIIYYLFTRSLFFGFYTTAFKELNFKQNYIYQSLYILNTFNHLGNKRVFPM